MLPLCVFAAVLAAAFGHRRAVRDHRPEVKYVGKGRRTIRRSSTPPRPIPPDGRSPGERRPRLTPELVRRINRAEANRVRLLKAAAARRRGAKRRATKVAA